MSRRSLLSATLLVTLALLLLLPFPRTVTAQLNYGEQLLGWPQYLSEGAWAELNLWDVAVGEVNTTLPGLEVVACTKSTVYVFPSNGSLHGQPLWTATPSGATYVYDVAVGDVDGDGACEVIAGADNGLHVIDDDGVEFAWSPVGSSKMYAVCAADLFNNGTVYAIGAGYNGFVVLCRGDGVYAEGQTQRAIVEGYKAGNIWYVTAGDVLGDSAQEIIAGYSVWNVSRTSVSISEVDEADEAPTSVSVADVDGDGVNEIIYAGGASWQAHSTLNITCWSFSGTTLAREWIFSTPGYARSVDVGDTDGDSLPDIAWGDSSGAVGIVNGTGHAILSAFRPGASSYVRPLKLADFDGDGSLEMAAHVDNDKLYCINAGGGIEWTFAEPEGAGSGGTFEAGADLDVNGDGYPDVCYSLSTYYLYVVCAPKAPSVELLSPANNQNSTSFTWTFQIRANDTQSGVVQINVTIWNSTGYYYNDSIPVSATTSYTWTFSHTLPGQGLYYWNASAKDAAGYVGTSPTYAFRIDRSPPSISLVGPANGTVIVDQTTVTLNVSVTEPSWGVGVDPSTVKAEVNGTEYAMTRKPGTDYYSVQVSGLSDGIYYWNVTASDILGNTGTSATWVFYVDTKAPVCSLVSPADDSWQPKNVLFQVSASDWPGSGIENVSVWVYNSSWSDQVVLSYNPSTGYYEASYSMPAGGDYYWNATAFDRAGHKNQTSSWIFHVDAIAPQVTLEVPDQGQVFLTSAEASSIDFNASASDVGTGVKSVWLFIDGVNYSQMTYLEGHYCVLDQDFTSNEGNHTWYVVAVDNAGNRGTSTVRWFVVDLSPPSIALEVPKAEGYTNNATVVFRAVVADAGGLASNPVLTVNGTAHTMSWVSGDLYEASLELPEGDYYWNVTATDIAGRTNTSETRHLVVDRTKPAASLKSPSDNEYTGYLTVTFRATVRDDRLVDYVELYVDWSYVGNMTYDPSTGEATYSLSLSEGTHYWHVIVRDKAGNTFQTTTYTFTVDLTAPRVSATSPSDVIISAHTVTFVASASDNFGIGRVELYVNGSYMGDMRFNGTDYILTLSMSDAVYTWYAVAYDLADNSATSPSNVFIVDTTPPSGYNIYPADGSVNSSSSITFVVKAWDNLEYAGTPLVWAVTLYVKDLASGSVTTQSMSYDLSTELASATVSLSDGNYEWWAVIDDYAGYSYETEHFLLTVDTTAPSATPISPASGSICPSSSVEFIVQASDLTLEEVDLYVDGLFYGPMSSNGTHFVLVVSLSDGIHTWYVTVRDEAGHSTTTSAISFSVDTAAPALAITSPADGSWFNYTEVTVNWTASDPSGIDHYEVSTDGVTWTDVGTSTSYVFSLAEGTNVVYVKAVDKAGHSTVERITVYVDLTPPAVSLVSPEDYAISASSSVEFEVSAQDVRLSSVVLYVDGVAYPMAEVEGKFVAVVSGLSEGIHSWYVIAYDEAGNKAVSPSRVFAVDLTPPTVVASYPPDGAVSPSSSVSVYLNCSDNLGPVTVYLYLDGSLFATATIPAESGTAHFLLNLTEGTHIWYAIVADAAGHASSLAPRILVVDLTPPTFVSASVLPSAYVNGTTVTFVANFTDAFGIDRVELWVDGRYYGTMSFDNASRLYVISAVLGNGTHTWFVRAYDKAGHYADSPQGTVTVSWPVAAKAVAPPRVAPVPSVIAWASLGIGLAALIGLIFVLILAWAAAPKKKES